MFIKNENMLSGINDVYNGILVTGDAVGDVMFYGAGAGKLPTASAVVADMVDSVIHASRRKLIGWKAAEGDTVAPFETKKFRYLMRCDGKGTITDPITVSECEEMKAKLNAQSAIRVLD